MNSTKKYPKNEFGKAVGEVLSAHGTTISSLAIMTGKQTAIYRVTSGYPDRHGKPYRANAQWADLVANALKVSDEEREKLHRAAAIDSGFKLDLTKK